MNNLKQGTISYIKSNINEYEFEYFFIKITHIGKFTAILQFIDNINKAVIPIPDNIEFYGINANGERIETPIDISYIISWFGDYVMRQKGKIIFQLFNQKQQTISGKLKSQRTYIDKDNIWINVVLKKCD